MKTAGFRVIQKPLLHAARCARPAFLPQSRPRGAKAQGLRFERSLARELDGLAAHGPWFTFEDSRGLGWCQPDFVLPRKDIAAAFILEAKLTWVAAAELKLKGLYLPVVAKALKVKTFGIVICKNLQPEAAAAGPICNTLDEALRLAFAGATPTLLWGSGTSAALLPRRRRAA